MSAGLGGLGIWAWVTRLTTVSIELLAIGTWAKLVYATSAVTSDAEFRAVTCKTSRIVFKAKVLLVG